MPKRITLTATRNVICGVITFKKISFSKSFLGRVGWEGKEELSYTYEVRKKINMGATRIMFRK